MQSLVSLCLLLLLSLVSAGFVTNQSCAIGGDNVPLYKDNWVTITPDQSGCSLVQFGSFFATTPATLIIGIQTQAAPNDITLTSVEAYPVHGASLLPPIAYITVTENQVEQPNPEFTCYQYPQGTGPTTELYFLVNTNITSEIFVTIIHEISESECYVTPPKDWHNDNNSNESGAWCWWIGLAVIILLVLIVIGTVIALITLVICCCCFKRTPYNRLTDFPIDRKSVV